LKLLEGVVTIEELKVRTKTVKKMMDGFYAFNGSEEGYFAKRIEAENQPRYKIIGSWTYVETQETIRETTPCY
jgi:hypothetical protein